MVLMTMIGRVADGLPLAASVHNEIRDEVRLCSPIAVSPSYVFFSLQSGRSGTEYQNQAKNILRRLGPTSPSKASIESDPYVFQ